MPASSQPALQAQSIIRGIMDRRGARCGLEEFHQSVNVFFHNFESEVYDREHQDMWRSLPRQFDLLVGDWLQSSTPPPSEIHLLDIGCGTGLASDCLLKTPIGPRIRSIDLLDTSPSMLQRAAERSASWGVPVQRHLGLLNALPPGRRYHLIVTCSVLHHVPDLPEFLAAVSALQSPGGAFLHLQDPNGDFLEDAELRRRMAAVSPSPLLERLNRFTPRRIFGRLYREITGKQGQDYVSKTNRALLEHGVVTEPLSVHEIFCITDIHVQDGQGVSIPRMEPWLPGYSCLSHRSYAFFGILASALPKRRRPMEEDLIARRAANGLHIGAVWRKNL